MRKLKGVFHLTLLSLVLVLFQPLSPDAAQKGFPEYEEIEYEHSIITVPIRFEGQTAPAEVLKLDAFMRLVRFKPVRNGLGYRQFEFFIDAWELYGYSKVLDANITFKLSDTVKPKSLGVALQKDRDYPAMIVYNAIYDVYLNDVKIIDKQPGVAFATGVMEIPPRNITVAFNKPFNSREARHRHPPGEGDGLKSATDRHAEYPDGDWVWDPGTCEDMTSISTEQFNAGLAEAERYRREFPGANRKGTGASRSNSNGSKKKNSK